MKLPSLLFICFLFFSCGREEPFRYPWPTQYDLAHFPPPYVRIIPDQWTAGDTIQVYATPFHPSQWLFFESYEYSAPFDSFQIMGSRNCSFIFTGPTTPLEKDTSEVLLRYAASRYHFDPSLRGTLHLPFVRVSENEWKVLNENAYYLLDVYREGEWDLLAKIPLGKDYFDISLPDGWEKMCNTDVTYKMYDPILPKMKSVSMKIPLPNALWLAANFPERGFLILRVFPYDKALPSFSFQEVDSMIQRGNIYAH